MKSSEKGKKKGHFGGEKREFGEKNKVGFMRKKWVEESVFWIENGGAEGENDNFFWGKIGGLEEKEI